MIIDFRELEDGTVVEADLCIIGAGAAGIAMAREFIGSGHQVCLLESGGFEIDADTQSLYQGDIVGQPYYELDTCRLRFLGGTTNHWAGWCGPLNPIDFEERAWVPHSGWPIGRADLDPYYLRAQGICGIGLSYVRLSSFSHDRAVRLRRVRCRCTWRDAHGWGQSTRRRWITL